MAVNKRILVTGGNGLLGQKVNQLFSRYQEMDVLTTAKATELADPSVSVGFHKLDITDRKAVVEIVKNFEPDIIINCAAMTHVDKCETDRQLCWSINVDGVKHLSDAARITDSKLIHISTDYIFDGKGGPYREDAKVNPISYYGKSKLASENIIISSGVDHVIFRTMVVFGVGKKVKANFATWLEQELRLEKKVSIVTDQIGNATLADELAEAIYISVKKNISGIYHAAGRDILSRYDFAVRLAHFFGYNSNLITPILTKDLNQPAPRPLHSGLLVLKAETDLGMKFSTLEQAFTQFKLQLKQTGK